ncbi:sigma-54-dependent transcriptional regulator [Hyalangium versicolor]|uniref:sigma-54-dependent transcriptional regulator n=1 Tax=Hyalangium versicolor TaxID=2861190 RepID=UPI001CCA1F4D|nr:sigma-54 dependent transcriptional regulator [Hyalangium versicolor]
MAAERILVVDDEDNARRAIVTILGEEGYEVAEASNGADALARIPEFSPAVVLTDVRMPQMDGLTLLKKAREMGSDATFVMMTAFASVETAVEAMRAGADNYLVKPLDADAVLVILTKALEKRSLRREAETLRDQVRQRTRFHNIIGDSPQLQGVYDVVRRAANTRATVLILGESGTGKELIAQALHQESPRKDKPFVRVHCAALSESLLESELFGHEKGSFTGAVARKEGRFELADGGTLFLDEIGEISPSVQVKLLRVLQQREFERVGGTQTLKVDVRIVAATHRDLQAEVKAGRFREDLFYRLNVVSVTLPPLRERKSDIPALVSHFLEKYSDSYGKHVKALAPGTLQALLAHDWPGNIRELENAIERAVVLAQGDELTTDDLPPVLRGPRPQGSSSNNLIPGASMATIEREAILRTLEMVQGSTSRAAEILGISVRKIQYRLKEYGSGKTPSSHDDADEAAAASRG